MTPTYPNLVSATRKFLDVRENLERLLTVDSDSVMSNLTIALGLVSDNVCIRQRQFLRRFICNAKQPKARIVICAFSCQLAHTCLLFYLPYFLYRCYHGQVRELEYNLQRLYMHLVAQDHLPT